MYALIQKKDVKSKELAKHLSEKIDLVFMQGSPIKMPFQFLFEISKRKKKPSAIVVRYLNDYESLIKSILRLNSDALTVFIAKIFRVKIIWLCHNVDRESKQYYPQLIKIRRSLMKKSSEKILVTDKYLVKYASRFLKVDQKKISYITFGLPHLNEEIEHETATHQKITSFVRETENSDTLFGLSLGNPNVKVLQPFYTNKLIEKARQNGIPLRIILGGPLSDFLKKHNHEEYIRLVSNPDVLLLDGKISINESFISNYVDFYWRVYDDYSVPFTVYNAAYLKKPILTMDKGFLKEMVLKYEIGSVLENDFSNIVQAIDGLKRNRVENYIEFTENHNWEIGAKNLYDAIFSKKP